MRQEDPASLTMSRSEALAQWLEKMIRNEDLAAGARLGTKDELRRRYSVAAGTLNETIRIMEMRGLVRARPGPGGGVFVAAPARQMQLNRLIVDFRPEGAGAINCLEVRNGLEPTVAAAAARGVTTASIRELRRILAAMTASVEDPAAYLKHNWALHRCLAETADNAVLRGIYIALLDFLAGEVEHVGSDPGFLPDVGENIARHSELVDAVASGDEDRARAAAHNHSPLVRSTDEDR